ncbi:MAG: N-acetylmuramoyl-L-alanine amidase [Chloroflexi bacterium]|jgi:hypothetical protein|nr:N-acetylmuramoyl-L-alanine amidase [Anaerolineaceae bacterium]NLI45279.1 N-acetylmuramoyl-L-alanine amidase [Chloroflexota bacterium]HOT25281.1 peptidoglycan recognition family protein [Anaerolineaceae bacterium]HQH57779.1 peptidoglycan recognition family protein [Anaerolineaceae bacterium]HQK02869.1 peptidoglycan recognition family protein [Anaerolineaceae bacterium]
MRKNTRIWLALLLSAALTAASCAPLPAASHTPTASPTYTQAPETASPPKVTNTPEPPASPTPSPTPDPTALLALLPVPPRFESAEDGERVFFGDAYKQLPEADTVDEIIVPELIIIHTDGQTANLPRNWNTESTFHGLGQWYSVHFAVSQYDILQMLPMYTYGVLHGSGAAPQYNDQGEWVTYNNRSIHIEMAGHDFNALIAGWANPEMKEAITKTTDKATDLVVSLLWYYHIDPANVLGHYQVGRGKADPGNLYFEQYFLPQMLEKWEALQKSLQP